MGKGLEKVKGKEARGEYKKSSPSSKQIFVLVRALHHHVLLGPLPSNNRTNRLPKMTKKLSSSSKANSHR
jgi:hypothetical protein